ncbi:elongation factor Ts [Rubritalea halochordaticola]|uniref:Elongation factor Ts n=1 Tax=Rubritalea halochordaticola TaxID=714537 RepID=A0ABP9V2L1_9BACT
MAITASAVKELRDKTNAGMMECKKALTETNGDLDAAVKLLREKGIVKAGKRSDRETSEGIIAASVNADSSAGVLVEVNCETDFVAKNENFTNFVEEVTGIIAEGAADSAEAALALTSGEGTVEDTLKAKFIELGEVIAVKRVNRFETAGTGSVASYIHMGGKVGVLIEVSCEKAETTSADTFQTLLKDITLHVAAANPAGLTRDDIDATVVEEENEINRKQLEAEGKPANIIDKILVGKINKFYSEQCLVEQAFVKDPDTSISKLLEAKGKELGDTLEIKRYARFSVGA